MRGTAAASNSCTEMFFGFSAILFTGIPVIFDTTVAMSSSVTTALTFLFPAAALSLTIDPASSMASMACRKGRK